MSVYKLKNAILNYPWGSRDSMGELLGYDNPENQPQAELWMGAHPKAPSMVLMDGAESSLGDIIKSNPEKVLGKGASLVFEGQLPFLFKVLAAGSPLSVQSHPSLEEAKIRFAKEEAAGVPYDAYNRNYKDPNHKPEILCALTPFTAMWGFRSLDAIRKVFSLLGKEGEALAAVSDLKAFFKFLMESSDEIKQALLDKALEKGVLPSGHSGTSWVPKLAKLYPGDVGALSPLYLNIVDLAPGEAIYVPAGELHAYLDGTGLELMANSDNVLRGGLTPKHVDIPELLEVLSFKSRNPEKVKYKEKGPLGSYKTPAREFLLNKIELGAKGYSHIPKSCEILLALSGAVSIEWAGGAMDFARGESVFISADAGKYVLKGEGVIFSASVPAAK